MATHRGRVVTGIFLLLHGLAHALRGMQIAAGTRAQWLDLLGVPELVILWTSTLLWSVALTGFAAAGFGRIGASYGRATIARPPRAPSRWRGSACSRSSPLISSWSDA